jgi:radical SAM superfamily enzyme YgiQ (UPF0313 family)
MSLHTLVVNPWATDFKLYDEWMHPVGLYYLIALLKKNGCEVSYYNCLSRTSGAELKSNGTGNFPFRPYSKPELYKGIRRYYKLYGQPEESFAKYLLSLPEPNVIFVGSSMTYWALGIIETVRVIKRIFPHILIVIGGTSAILIPSFLTTSLPDIHLFKGSLFDHKAITGSGIPCLSSMRALDCDASLIPAFELLKAANHGPALSSRGCPLRCSYCASRFLHNRYEARPAPVVAEELGFLQARFDVKNFAWYDDALLYKPHQHFIPLMRALSQAGITASFHAPNGLHVRWLTQEALEAMRAGGFMTLRFGYESGSRAFNGETGGKVRKEELEKKTGLALKTGFCGRDIGVYVMAGLTGQSPKEVADEIKFVASLSVKVKPVFFSPVPKTPLFEKYSRRFPQLLKTPLFHNDTFFITQLPGWDASAVQDIIDLAKWYNERISDKVT